MRGMRRTAILCKGFVFFAALFGGALQGQDLLQPAGAEDTVAQARSLATNKPRTEALRPLEAPLVQSPEDSDARVLYGTVLSWEGRYDESREELTRVLA